MPDFGLGDTAAKRAARSYARMASFFERRADELKRQAEAATSPAMRDVLMQGSERSRQHADQLRRALLSELTVDDIGGLHR